MEVKLVASNPVSYDFPILLDEKYNGVILADSFYIMVEDDELLEDGFVVSEDIDLLIGKGGYKKLCNGHNAVIDSDNDVYFINKWDGEQVLSKLKKELIKQGYDVK